MSYELNNYFRLSVDWFKLLEIYSITIDFEFAKL